MPGWKDLLTAQFHDSLPGTHVPASLCGPPEDYRRIFASAESRCATMPLDALRRAHAGWPGNDRIGCSTAFLRAAGCGHVCRKRIWPGTARLPTLKASRFRNRTVTDLEGKTWRPASVTDVAGDRVPCVCRCRGDALRDDRDSPRVSGELVLENAFLRAEFNSTGRTALSV